MWYFRKNDSINQGKLQILYLNSVPNNPSLQR